MITFAEIYILDPDCRFNGKESAIKAGYAKKSAAVTASNLLKHELVMEHMAKISQEVRIQAGVTKEEIVDSIAKLARFNIKKAIDPDGNIMNPHDMDDDTAFAITDYKTKKRRSRTGPDDEWEVEDEERQIKTPDKLKSWESLGKMTQFDLYSKDEQHIHYHFPDMTPEERHKKILELEAKLGIKDGNISNKPLV